MGGPGHIEKNPFRLPANGNHVPEERVPAAGLCVSRCYLGGAVAGVTSSFPSIPFARWLLPRNDLSQ